MDAWIDVFKHNPASCLIIIGAVLVGGWIVVRILRDGNGGGRHR